MKFFAIVFFALVAATNADYWGAPLAAVPAVPVYQKSYIPTTVKLGETYHSYPVTEHRFTRTDYETPGATYAIPAVKTYSVTRPGYTTYLNSAITKTHVTNHQVAGPTIVKPIIAPVLHKALAPIAHVPLAAAPLAAAPGWW